MYRLLSFDRGRDALLLCLFLLGLQQLAGAALIEMKAWLAPQLIERAWQRTLASGGQPARPWPWADTWPVARLRAPAQGVERLVLSGGSGNALAFGPGHASISAPPGSKGRAVIGGHRDTHFAFLQQLENADLVQLQLPDGSWRTYRVETVRVANSEREKLSADVEGEQLTLVTCYPFDTIRTGGPLRYVVEARPLEEGILSAYTGKQRLL